ncbi:GGDEF domain-containing protein [uncultured Salinisphaera sp.]|uniref:GGDEF domain-containing protein n=1 Tax=uncultured Salinisphaera sp. TaxID=359372 RepID=UPI0032B23DAA|tara:strand:- start:1550 stop:2776 length:1227 start_codon:yes stop_codon:yes gene_type:complete
MARHQELPWRILDRHGLTLTNPMDWRAIDRHILLAVLVMLAPLCLGGYLLGTLVIAPEFLHVDVAIALLAFYALFSVVFGSLITSAFFLRRQVDEWRSFEYVVIYGFIVVVLLTGYLTGTYLSHALLLLFLGVNITSALSDVDKIRVAYWQVGAVLSVMTGVNLLGWATYAPLFSQSVHTPAGAPFMGWFFAEIFLAAVLFALVYLVTSAIKRWVVREELFKNMSKTDGLTQLTNRSTFIDQASKEIARGKRFIDESRPWISCVMIDLDYFKQINDTLGHAAGDATLVDVSRILKNNVREYDEVGRYGGEEFSVMLPATGPETARAIAERLRHAIEASEVHYGDRPIRYTASFGVASQRYAQLEELNDLLKEADAALYDAKRSGRNRVVFYNSDVGAGRSGKQVKALG